MGSFEITSVIINEIEKSIDLGFDRLYVNVDDLENGKGFLRVLAMQESGYLIVFEDTLDLDICFEILGLLEKSGYGIKDFTA